MPSSSTTRVTVRSRNRRSCEITRTAPANPARCWLSQRRPSRSRWLVGSSSSSTSGSVTRRRASITRACSPPLRLPIVRRPSMPSAPSTPSRERTCSIRVRPAQPPRASNSSRAAAYPARCPGVAPSRAASRRRTVAWAATRAGAPERTICSTVMAGSGASWACQPTVSPGERTTAPAVGGSRPARTRIRVDLPTPPGPTSPTRSPGDRVRSRPSKSGSRSTCLLRDTARNTGGAPSRSRWDDGSGGRRARRPSVDGARRGDAGVRAARRQGASPRAARQAVFPHPGTPAAPQRALRGRRSGGSAGLLAHGVHAAVDVDDLAGRGREPVGQQGDARLARRAPGR